MVFNESNKFVKQIELEIENDYSHAISALKHKAYLTATHPIFRIEHNLHYALGMEVPAKLSEIKQSLYNKGLAQELKNAQEYIEKGNDILAYSAIIGIQNAAMRSMGCEIPKEVLELEGKIKEIQDKRISESVEYRNRGNERMIIDNVHRRNKT